MLNLAGNEFDEQDLIGRVMQNIRGNSRNPQPRWVLVRDQFAVGSTVSKALCREFDLDPDEVIPK